MITLFIQKRKLLTTLCATTFGLLCILSASLKFQQSVKSENKRETKTSSLTFNDSSGTWCRENLKMLLPKPGFTELRQFHTAQKFSVNAMAYTHENFDAIRASIYYDVTWLQQHDCIAFFVHERRRGHVRHQTPIRGGSAFHTVIVGSNTIDFCPYVDHDNDTYTVFCPLYEPCVHVISHLIHFDYLGFWQHKEFNRRLANRIAFKQQLCINTGATRQQWFFPRLKTPYWSRNEAGKAISYDIEWSKSFDWHLQLDDSTSVPQFTEEAYKRCKANISSLYFIGDSHVDMISMHAMNLEGAAERWGKSGIVTGIKGRHFEATFLPKLQQILQDCKQNKTAKKPTVIVADIGLHDVCDYGLKYVYSSVLPMLVKNLHRMQRAGLLDNVKILLLSITALPPLSIPQNYHRGANTAAITALNRRMADLLARDRINVTFVEYYELARNFINKTSHLLDNHYLNYNRTHMLGKRVIMYGPVGLELMNYVMSLVCPQA